MPWRGPEYPGEFPTLGYQVGDLIEACCVIPDGDQVGEPYLLTDEMWHHLLWLYRIDPKSGKFVFERGSQLVRPQKWGKGPFSSAVVIVEAHPEGPVRPAGWNAAGEPVGRPWATPWIQVTAVSGDQTDNVWLALLPMIELSALRFDIPDTGRTRINLPHGGKIEPVTSSHHSRLGQRITFCVEDETHSWTAHNQGRRVADTQRRNLAGMNGRFLETTNAWNPTEESVAQQTSESQAPGVYLDDVDPGSGSINNRRDRRRMLRKVYGDSHWVDLDRIDMEIVELLTRDPGQAERFFLNRKRGEGDAAFDPEVWKARVDDRVVPDGALITIGVDGARWDDALAVVGTEVETGHQFVIGIWEQPPDADDDYEHPLDDVDGTMVETFDRFSVWRVYCDPQRIETLIDRWQGRWGEKTVLEWWTNRPKQMAYAVRRYSEAITAGDLSNDGDVQMAQHVGHARRQMLNVVDDHKRRMWTVQKDRPMSPRKIDAVPAGVLSWEARGDAIAAGATVKKQQYRAFKR
ncbi:MAG: hypothetical protein P1T08_12850 [Acidimicrobiia bacterium]|nr:hypothetical protein [Acidimicrobiia bacterium]